MMTDKNMKKEIKDGEFYTPKEAVGFGIMTANNEDTQRQMLLRKIKNGEIKAKNVGGEKKARFLIQGKELIAYRDAQMKRGKYVTK